MKVEYLHVRLLERSRLMKVIIEIDGRPSEVAALAREIAGRHEPGGFSIGSLDCVVSESVAKVFETLEERADD